MNVRLTFTCCVKRTEMKTDLKLFYSSSDTEVQPRYKFWLFGLNNILFAIRYMHIQSNFNGSNTFGTIKYVRDRGSSSQ